MAGARIAEQRRSTELSAERENTLFEVARPNGIYATEFMSAALPNDALVESTGRARWWGCYAS
jgi:hypothetical protein